MLSPTKTITTLAASALLVAISHAANIAQNTGTLTTTLTVDTGNYFQSTTGTLDINAGGSIVIRNAQFETIIGQNTVGGNSTININAGGSMDFSLATGAGVTLFLGNNQATGFGIINLNGGTFNGSGITDFKLGRDGGNGQINISAGTFTLGDSTPLFDVTAAGAPNGSNNNSYFNFTNGSTGTLAITGANLAFYQGLWNTQDLRFAGANTGTFADHFVVNGNVLSAVPEPSIALLGGLGLLGLLRRRR